MNFTFVWNKEKYFIGFLLQNWNPKQQTKGLLKLNNNNLQTLTSTFLHFDIKEEANSHNQNGRRNERHGKGESCLDPSSDTSLNSCLDFGLNPVFSLSSSLVNWSFTNEMPSWFICMLPCLSGWLDNFFYCSVLFDKVLLVEFVVCSF